MKPVLHNLDRILEREMLRTRYCKFVLDDYNEFWLP